MDSDEPARPDQPRTSPPDDPQQLRAELAERTTERDDARAQLQIVQADLARLRAWIARHPCPARTPIHQSTCRWSFGHDGVHQTIGGWTWTT